jgi:hypothetical protein
VSSEWNDHKLWVAGAAAQQSYFMVLIFGSFHLKKIKTDHTAASNHGATKLKMSPRNTSIELTSSELRS